MENPSSIKGSIFQPAMLVDPGVYYALDLGPQDASGQRKD